MEVLHLNPNSNSQSSIPNFTIKKTHHRKHVDEVVVNGVRRARVLIYGSANGNQINGLKQRHICEGNKLINKTHRRY